MSEPRNQSQTCGQPRKQSKRRCFRQRFVRTGAGDLVGGRGHSGCRRDRQRVRVRKLGRHRERRFGAALRIFLQALTHDALDRGIQMRVQFQQRGWVRALVLAGQLGERLALEGRSTAEDFVEYQT